MILGSSLVSHAQLYTYLAVEAEAGAKSLREFHSSPETLYSPLDFRAFSYPLRRLIFSLQALSLGYLEKSKPGSIAENSTGNSKLMSAAVKAFPASLKDKASSSMDLSVYNALLQSNLAVARIHQIKNLPNLDLHCRCSRLRREQNWTPFTVTLCRQHLPRQVIYPSWSIACCIIIQAQSPTTHAC